MIKIQRQVLLTIITLALLAAGGLHAKDLKPYLVGARVSTSVEATIQAVRGAVERAGFTVLGGYAPAGDANRWSIAITNPALQEAAITLGSLGAFGAVLRVGITAEGGETVISYTHPVYLGIAYAQSRYSEVASAYAAATESLFEALGALGHGGGEVFGATEGLDQTKLQRYHYMFGMERFDDVSTVGTFSSYDEAIATIEKNLASGGPATKVYELELPGQELKVYGIALGGDTGEEHFLPIIDITTPKHTAFLPYEILVMGGEVVMMHGRYRIALAFPDLTMMTFGKIMSTPGNIRDLMRGFTR